MDRRHRLDRGELLRRLCKLCPLWHVGTVGIYPGHFLYHVLYVVIRHHGLHESLDRHAPASLIGKRCRPVSARRVAEKKRGGQARADGDKEPEKETSMKREQARLEAL